MGTKRNNHGPFTEAQEQQIEDAYKEHSIYWIAQQWDAYPDRIRGVLVKRGVKIRNYREGITRRTYVPPRRNSVNDHAFDNLEDNDVACYFLGLLLTDGTILKRNYRSGFVSLSQAEDNKDIVFKFRDFMSGSGDVTELAPKDPKHQVRFTFKFSSIHIVNVLESYGVVERKTSNQTVDPRVANNRHFWRGVFDGDGHIEVNPRTGLRLSTTSPILFSEWERYARLVTGTDNIVYRRELETNKIEQTLWLTGTEAKVMAIMLYTDHTVSINRKQQIADAIIDG